MLPLFHRCAVTKVAARELFSSMHGRVVDAEGVSRMVEGDGGIPSSKPRHTKPGSLGATGTPVLLSHSHMGVIRNRTYKKRAINTSTTNSNYNSYSYQYHPSSPAQDSGQHTTEGGSGTVGGDWVFPGVGGCPGAGPRGLGAGVGGCLVVP